jgi:hypothetical protein
MEWGQVSCVYFSPTKVTFNYAELTGFIRLLSQPVRTKPNVVSNTLDPREARCTVKPLLRISVEQLFER